MTPEEEDFWRKELEAIRDSINDVAKAIRETNERSK